VRRSALGPSLALALAAAVGSPGSAPAQSLTADQWREDLHTLATELPERHRDAFHAVSRAAFDSAVGELDRAIPTLSDAGVIVGMARIVAMLGDGHTRLTLPLDSTVAFEMGESPTPLPGDSSLVFHHLPVRFYRFEDGLAVREATAGHRDLLGARVLQIGRLSADSAWALAAPTVSADNDSQRRLLVPTRLGVAEVLRALGATGDTGAVRLTVRTPDGRTLTRELEPLPRHPQVRWLDARRAAEAALPSPREDRALAYLPSARTAYVRLDRIREEEGRTMAAFSRRLADILAARRPDRLVLDLRHCRGGDNSQARPVVLALFRHPEIDRFGRLYVLVGRETFSACVGLAGQLEQWTQALFVGEPTGGSPNSYGDARRFRLPHSGLTVRAATVYWRGWTSDESRNSIAPDLPAAPTVNDYVGGRDVVLRAALAFPLRSSLRDVVLRIDEAGGLQRAVLAWYRAAADPSPDTAGEVPAALDTLGAHLMAGEQYGAAEAVYGVAARRRPDDAGTWLRLGRAALRAGDDNRARSALRRTLELDPSSEEARRLLGEAGGE